MYYLRDRQYRFLQSSNIGYYGKKKKWGKASANSCTKEHTPAFFLVLSHSRIMHCIRFFFLSLIYSVKDLQSFCFPDFETFESTQQLFLFNGF